MKTPTGFQYSKTKSVIRFNWKDGAWDEGELVQDDHFSLSYSATVLHYGQAAFEGMKAFRHADGETYVFRPFENCERLRQSCERLLMPVVSPEMFGSALKRVIEDNQDFVPDVESGGSLYIRPFVFGSGPTIGVRPSPEYQFVVLVMPVGDYYTPTAGNTGLNALIFDDYDRAAPYGLGNVKAAGNYSADLLPAKKAKDMGHDIVLYLDAKTRTLIEEFGTSNFVAISKDGSYVTPDSKTILQSITNKSLRELAESKGLKVEHRKVKLQEIIDFTSIGACGTAVVYSPLSSITYRGERVWTSESQKPSAIMSDLVKGYKQIQRGEAEDHLGWLVKTTEL